MNNYDVPPCGHLEDMLFAAYVSQSSNLIASSCIGHIGELLMFERLVIEFLVFIHCNN